MYDSSSIYIHGLSGIGRRGRRTTGELTRDADVEGILARLAG